MTDEPRRSVAIIGSGPSACYTAQALLKLRRDVDITMFERLPVPYGLIRYGVAPDHVGTKAVTRQFDRLFTRSGVRFLGNVEVGRDVDFDDVRGAFDATVVATGLHEDAKLLLPGFDDHRVVGAGRFMRILNQHPGEEVSLPKLGNRVAVIGNGNVAIDIVRILAKHEDDFEGSDVHSPLLAEASGGLQVIEVLGRASLDEAKFTPSLLAELGRIHDVRFEAYGTGGSSLAAGAEADVGAEADAGEGAPTAPGVGAETDVLQRSPQAVALAGLLDRPQPEHPRITVRLRFGVTPVALVEVQAEAQPQAEDRDRDRAEAPGTLRLGMVGPGASETGASETGASKAVDTKVGTSKLGASTSTEPVFAEVDSVITAVGFHRGDAHLLHALLGHEEDVFAAGWARRGAQGTIAESRAEGQTVAREVEGQLTALAPKPASEREKLLARLEEPSVSFAEWSVVDEHEVRRAGPGRVRAKEQDTATLLRIARGPTSAAQDHHTESNN